jgi:hypothetical protein
MLSAIGVNIGVGQSVRMHQRPERIDRDLAIAKCIEQIVQVLLSRLYSSSRLNAGG